MNPEQPKHPKEEVEEYDYTAQTLLQAPLESGTRRQKRYGKQEKNKRKHNAKPMTAFIAILCFALSYGIANIFYQYRTGNSSITLQQVLSFYQRENIFLSIILIAVTSSLVIAILAILIQFGRKLFQIQGPASKGLPKDMAQQEQTPKRLQKRKTFKQKPYEDPKNSRNSKNAEDIGYMGNIQFYSNLNFLLKKKTRYLLQSLLGIFACIFLSFICFVFLAFGLNIIEQTFFAMTFLLFALLFGTLLRNQYVQGIESLLQSTLQQVYQHSSPTNSYSQLNAVNMLYALAFVESKLTQSRVITEFQNILILTRSSWYQAKYTNSPSILVEEVLRKLISTVDFHRFVYIRQKQDDWTKENLTKTPTKQQIGSSILQKVFRGAAWESVQKFSIYLLFLKDFQDLRAFRDHESVSLLSQMSSTPHEMGFFPDTHNFFQNTRKKHIQPNFILENYYLVGINLSKLRVKEAHFQNCQLSHSTWADSELSDCSIASSRLDQAILCQSSWRRFLWHGNIAREIDIENCFYLQGNIQQCNLQAIQNQPLSTLQHCLLQECDLSHSTLRIDAWQSVTASDCNWYEAWISLDRELYAAQDCVEAPLLKNKLQIKQNS